MTARTRVPRRAALLAAIALCAFAASAAFGHSNTISTVPGTGLDVAPLLGGGYLVADYDARVVRKVDKYGLVTTVAGTGASGSSGDGGPALSAAVSPESVSPTADGGFLIADRDNHRVRKVGPDGVIVTVAGDGNGSFSGDGGPATAASLSNPADALELADGSILIADTGNARVRKVDADGVITTVAGTGDLIDIGILAIEISLDAPTDLAALPDGGFAFVDAGSTDLYVVGPDGSVETVPAAFHGPSGVAALSDGGFLVADRSGHKVYRVAPDGTVSTAAGTGNSGNTGDGGDAAAAQLSNPHDVTVAPGTGYYVADAGNDTVRFVDADVLPAVGPGGADVVAPPAPVITSSPGATGTSTTPSWSFVLPEAGTTAWCRLKPAANWAPCTSPVRYDLSGEADGDYTFGVKAKDAAGNSSSAATSAYALDRPDPVVPGTPAAPVITAAPPATGSDERPSWAFTVDRGATAQCRLERTSAIVSDWAACSSPAVFDLSGRKNGKYRFLVRAVGAQGATSAWQTGEYHLIRSLGKVPEVGRNQLPPGAPAPKIGRKLSVVPAAGVVRIKVPGKHRFVPLEDALALPVGTVFDARRGEVALSTAVDRDGNTQTGMFRGGRFAVRQSRKGNGRTHLALRGGDFSRCARRGEVQASAAGKRKRRVRRLWGRDRGGRYSTHGRNSAATVRGTEWLTEDRCDGTRTKVRSGAVKVRDQVTGRRVIVRAGESYLARVPR